MNVYTTSRGLKVPGLNQILSKNFNKKRRFNNQNISKTYLGMKVFYIQNGLKSDKK